MPFYLSARLGSISSANPEINPASSRNIAAKAIIAALSVQSHGSATSSSIPFFSHASRRVSRSARLQLTPPLNVSRPDLVCRTASQTFLAQHIDDCLLKRSAEIVHHTVIPSEAGDPVELAVARPD